MNSRMVSPHTLLLCVGISAAFCPTAFSDVAHASAAARPDERNPGVERPRRWEPQDSVAIRYYSSDIRFSPDGSHFFVKSWHGDLSCDCDITELKVFSSNDVRASLEAKLLGQNMGPKLIAQIVRRSRGVRQPIAMFSTSWDSSGKAIEFQSPDENGILQFYSLEIASQEVLTKTRWAVSPTFMVGSGDLFLAELPIPERTLDFRFSYPFDRVTPSNLNGQLLIFEGDALALAPTATFISYRADKPWEVTEFSLDFVDSFGVSFSPNGGRLILGGSFHTLPPSWTGYDAVTGVDGFGRTFVNVDAASKTSKPLIDAPFGSVTQVGRRASQRGVGEQVLWPDVQDHVVLVNTALPLRSKKDRERARMSYIIDYDYAKRRWSIIEPLEQLSRTGSPQLVTKVNWRIPGKELWVGHSNGKDKTSSTVYRLEGQRWVGEAVGTEARDLDPIATKEEDSSLQVRLRQGPNEAPSVIATGNRSEVRLSESDPALDGLTIADQRPFHWIDINGKSMEGGLLLPPARSGRVPLVIQAYRYSRNTFSPDGPTTHAYAAQALVARGVAVLNIDIPLLEVPQITGPTELPIFAQRLQTVIDKLSSEGLVDPTRVGLVGFSRAGYEAFFSISHPGKNIIRAAVIDDAHSGAFGSYLADIATGGASTRGDEIVYEGSFWQNPKNWLAQDSIFNTDKIQTAALFTGHRRSAPIRSLDTIGAFSRNRRPFEYLVFPDASHELATPRQRLASYQATVDWMTFWLKDELPSDPDRATRWSKMKTDWTKQRAWEAAGHPVGSEPAADFTVTAEPETKH